MSLLKQFDGLKDFQQLYKNIDLGILVTQDGKLMQANDFFEEFMKNFSSDKTKFLDLRIFNVVRKAHNSAEMSSDSQ